MEDPVEVFREIEEDKAIPCLYRHLSGPRSGRLVREIDRYLLGTLLIPFLAIDLVWASLKASGILPHENERVKTAERTSEKMATQLLTTKGWMQSIPGDFLGFKRMMYLRTFAAEKNSVVI